MKQETNLPAGIKPRLLPISCRELAKQANLDEGKILNIAHHLIYEGVFDVVEYTLTEDGDILWSIAEADFCERVSSWTVTNSMWHAILTVHKEYRQSPQHDPQAEVIIDDFIKGIVHADAREECEAKGYTESTATFIERLQVVYEEHSTELQRIIKDIPNWDFDKAVQAALNICSNNTKIDRIDALLRWMEQSVNEANKKERCTVIQKTCALAVVARMELARLSLENVKLSEQISEETQIIQKSLDNAEEVKQLHTELSKKMHLFDLNEEIIEHLVKCEPLVHTITAKVLNAYTDNQREKPVKAAPEGIEEYLKRQAHLC